jgi:hypothetical protein
LDDHRSWVVYVREGCHLCDVFLQELAVELGREFDEVGVVDVDDDVDLAVRYGLRVPVLEHRGVIVCEARIDAERIRALRL